MLQELGLSKITLKKKSNHLSICWPWSFPPQVQLDPLQLPWLKNKEKCFCTSSLRLYSFWMQGHLSSHELKSRELRSRAAAAVSSHSWVTGKTTTKTWIWKCVKCLGNRWWYKFLILSNPPENTTAFQYVSLWSSVREWNVQEQHLCVCVCAGAAERFHTSQCGLLRFRPTAPCVWWERVCEGSVEQEISLEVLMQPSPNLFCNPRFRHVGRTRSKLPHVHTLRVNYFKMPLNILISANWIFKSNQ